MNLETVFSFCLFCFVEKRTRPPTTRAQATEGVGFEKLNQNSCMRVKTPN